jgi:integrase/recombinase XerD
MTPEEALLEFRAWLTVHHYRPASVKSYTEMLRPFWAWLAQESITDLRAVTRAGLERYAAHVLAQPLSRGTQALRLRALKRLFACLVEANQLLLDPAGGLRDPEAGGRLPRPVLTPAEVARLLAQPNTSLQVGIRDRAILELFYATGLRIGEVLALTVYDVDLEAGLLRVRTSKSGRGRVVPLGTGAGRWLREYLERVRPRPSRFAPHARALFLTQQGRALTHHVLRGLLQRYVRAAQLRPHVTCHTLRHSCATHLLEAGADLGAIQELLGHRDLRTTQIYTRVRPVEVKAMHQQTHPRERGEPPAGGDDAA